MSKLLYDHHTHTTFSHGKGSIEDNVRVAIQRGLCSVAITDHGPGHLTYGVKRSELSLMREEVDFLNEKYKEIDIKLGVEANIMDTENGLDLTENDKKYLDFIIAGYHFGVRHGSCIHNYTYSHGLKIGRKALEKKNTELTIRAIENNDIYVLTHPGDKGPIDLEHVAAYCERHNTLMEINAKHPHLSVDEIKRVMPFDIKFIISSDAHTPLNVGRCDEPIARAKEAGLNFSRIVNVEE